MSKANPGQGWTVAALTQLGTGKRLGCSLGQDSRATPASLNSLGSGAWEEEMASWSVASETLEKVQ